MKLDHNEVQLIQQLRSLPTVKVTVVKHAGAFKMIKAEINSEILLAADAEAKKAGKPQVVRVREVPGTPPEGQELVPTREGA